MRGVGWGGWMGQNISFFMFIHRLLQAGEPRPNLTPKVIYLNISQAFQNRLSSICMEFLL